MPTRLPVVVGFGGYNAAGRSSFHHGFRRMVIESLPELERQETIAGLAIMMGLVKSDSSGFQSLQGEALSLAEIEAQYSQQVLDGTLIRRIGKQYFDVDATPWQSTMKLTAAAEPLTFITRARQLPATLPEGWSVTPLDDGDYVRVETTEAEFKVDNTRDCPVKAAGQLPDGFEPAALYKSRFHPRGLQMAVLGASDAIHSLGLSWQTIADSVGPDQVAVFASSVMSQADDEGFGGMMQSRLKGGRISAKQLPLGLNTMPADFINAYVLGSVGVTGATTGACATFLYNLQHAVEGIQTGKFRVAVVGSSEAPVTPEIVEGFAAMSALASEEGLKKLDDSDEVDYRRTSRPFGNNCGFTIGEAAHFTILMDDELALELGANIHAAVTDVFINADGFKKSISAPGCGNYITMAKAVASARAIVGDEGVRQRSFVHAHGSSTPGNRTTESEIFDSVAKAFDIHNWPVTAVKAYVGHTIGPASGDQFMSALGSFHYGIIPGIKTIDRVADDVASERLTISSTDICREQESWDVAFINSKGFGGNNATGVMVAPHIVEAMLLKRYGEKRLTEWKKRRETVNEKAEAYDQAALHGQYDVIYNFGENMVDEHQIVLDSGKISLPGYTHSINLDFGSRYDDMV